MADFEQQPAITLSGAQKVLAAAVATAKQIGVNVVVVVTDSAGNPVATARMDGAPLFSITVAEKKAWTSAAAGARTADIAIQFNADPVLLHALAPKVDKVIAVGGGAPIKTDGQTAGAIGISGASETQDQEIADAAANHI